MEEEIKAGDWIAYPVTTLSRHYPNEGVAKCIRTTKTIVFYKANGHTCRVSKEKARKVTSLEVKEIKKEWKFATKVSLLKTLNWESLSKDNLMKVIAFLDAERLL